MEHLNPNMHRSQMIIPKRPYLLHKKEEIIPDSAQIIKKSLSCFVRGYFSDLVLISLISELKNRSEPVLKSRNTGLLTTVYTTEQARAHLRKFCADLGLPPIPTNAKIADHFKDAQEVSAWFSEGYLGPALAARFELYPVFISSPPKHWYNCLERDCRSRLGKYLSKSNHVIISPYLTNLDETMTVIAHEILHYLAELGGGMTNIYCLGSSINLTADGIVWFHEGLTELLAQQISRAHGFCFEYPTPYPLETTVAWGLQNLAGEYALRQAHLSGDFTKIRAMVNKEFGAGTFEKIIYSGCAESAILFLHSVGYAPPPTVSKDGIISNLWPVFVAICQAEIEKQITVSSGNSRIQSISSSP